MLLLVISAFYYSLQFVFDCSIFVDDKSLLNYEEGTQAAQKARDVQYAEEEGCVTKVFPSVLIALDVCAAMPYAWHGNWRMMIYWLAAATLTACVTFTGGK